jgi:hypothetical protein
LPVFDAEPSGVVTITIAEGQTVFVGRSVDAITANGVACGAATVNNTDRVDMLAATNSGSETAVVDLQDGPLVPGATDEGDGSSEIEIHVVLMDGGADELRILGDSLDTHLTSSLLDVNLNPDESVHDPDVTTESLLLKLELFGNNGNDNLELQEDGVPSFFADPLLSGGAFDDHLVSMAGGDDATLNGGTGHDTADYSHAADPLFYVWEEGSATVIGSGVTDAVRRIEVAIGSPHDDDFVLATSEGEVRAGEGTDTIVVAVPFLAPTGPRVANGGPGPDFLELTTTDPLVLNLDLLRIRGAWTGRWARIEFLTAGDGDDRIVASRTGGDPAVFGDDGFDVFELRSANEAVRVSGGGSAGPHWTTAAVDRMLGSSFPDVLEGSAPTT